MDGHHLEFLKMYGQIMPIAVPWTLSGGRGRDRRQVLNSLKLEMSVAGGGHAIIVPYGTQIILPVNDSEQVLSSFCREDNYSEILRNLQNISTQSGSADSARVDGHIADRGCWESSAPRGRWGCCNEDSLLCLSYVKRTNFIPIIGLRYYLLIGVITWRDRSISPDSGALLR